MSNHEYVSYDGSMSYIQGPDTVQRQGHERTAVFENLAGSKNFAKKIIRFMESDGGQITNLSINGTPGVGKETIGGQFITYISENKSLNNWLNSEGKRLEINYLSFGDMVGFAVDRGWVSNKIGGLSREEYFGLSVLYRDTAAALNEEDIDEDVRRLNIFETPAVLEIPKGVEGRPPGGRGAYALQYLGREQRNSHFSIAVVGDEKVKDISSHLRGILEQQDIDQESIIEFFKENNIVWENFDLSKVPHYRDTVGKSKFIEAQANDLLDDIQNAKNSGDVFPDDFIDTIDVEMLKRDPAARSRIEEEYYKAWLPKKYNIDPKKLLVVQNSRLPIEKVHFFRDTVSRHIVDIEPHLERFAEKYSNKDE